jgi:hypothetical protein
MNSGLFGFWLRSGSVTGLFQTCSFTGASPKPKNPRCTPLHLLWKCSNFSKLQIPSSKLQRSLKEAAKVLRFNLMFGISLELGTWNLELFFLGQLPIESTPFQALVKEGMVGNYLPPFLWYENNFIYLPGIAWNFGRRAVDPTGFHSHTSQSHGWHVYFHHDSAHQPTRIHQHAVATDQRTFSSIGRFGEDVAHLTNEH